MKPVTDLTTATVLQSSTTELCMLIFILCGIISGLLIYLANQENKSSREYKLLTSAAATFFIIALFFGLGI